MCAGAPRDDVQDGLGAQPVLVVQQDVPREVLVGKRGADIPQRSGPNGNPVDELSKRVEVFLFQVARAALFGKVSVDVAVVEIVVLGNESVLHNVVQQVLHNVAIVEAELGIGNANKRCPYAARAVNDIGKGMESSLVLLVQLPLLRQASAALQRLHHAPQPQQPRNATD